VRELVRKTAAQTLTQSELIDLAGQYAQKLIPGDVVYLLGDLGAGKTTFVRGVLQALGIKTLIKSPTYTLIESYLINNNYYHHLDLYRLGDPSEFEDLGVLDPQLNLNQRPVLFIEWPECGEGFVPPASYILEFSHHDSDPELRGFREVNS